MANSVTIAGQVVQNALNNQFTYSFGYNPATQVYFQANCLVDTTFTVIDPATEDTLHSALIALQAIEVSDTTVATQSTAAATSLAAIQTSVGNSGPCTITQTIEPLAQGASYTVAANPARKSLRWMVTGIGSVVVAPGTSAPQNGNSGYVYDGPASATNAQGVTSKNQGSSETFDGPAVPTNAFTFLAFDNATTLVIWEGA